MANDSDDSVREDIAFIRRAVEQGRGYAGSCGLDMLIWGVAVAAGYLGTYATVKGWWRIAPNLLWAVCIVLPSYSGGTGHTSNAAQNAKRKT